MLKILRYEGIYQIQFEQELKNEVYEFTSNSDDNYIVLKKGSIYRFSKNELVINLKYDSIIKSITTDIKSPLKEIYNDLKKSLKIIDKDFFDDGIELHISESDIGQAMEILTKHKCGTYENRKSRSPKSFMNLHDYKFRQQEFKAIKHKKKFEELKSAIKDKAFELGKEEITIYKMIYTGLKKELNLTSTISKLAKDEGIEPLNLIDRNNWYKECFKLLSEVL